LKPKLPKPIEELAVKKKRETGTLLCQRGQATKRPQTRRHGKNEAGSKKSLNAVEESNMP